MSLKISMDEELIKNLEDSGKFQVLRKIETPDFYDQYDGSKIFQGLYLDIETSGLSFSSDKILEIGLIKFEFSESGKIFKVLDCYSGLEDPKFSLSDKVIGMTGFNNKLLAGKSFVDEEIEKLVKPINLIVAHHASFDRQFCEKRFPFFKTKPWSCSESQIQWLEQGFSSTKLELLAHQYKYFYDPHRAMPDCCAGLHLLTQQLPSGNRVLQTLIKNAQSKSFRVWAVKSGYSKKDILKARGYKWFPGGGGRDKSWFKELDQENLEPELEYLEKEIYGRDIKGLLPIDHVTAFDRFSGRI